MIGMDGKQFTVGDQVHDLLYGGGTVVAVNGTGPYVEFKNLSQQYTHSGVSMTWKRRMLYWFEPMVVGTTADGRLNAAIFEGVNSTISSITKAYHYGKT